MQSNGQIQFTIAGRRISLTRKDVENALRNVKPEPIKRYSVKINGTDYPPKQAVSIATGVPAIAFITTTAYRVLTRLGFEVRV